MPPSPDVSVTIDLTRVRRNAESIAAATAKPVLAVIKADAYGLGAADVALAIADVVAGFYVFRPDEAADAKLDRFGKHVVALYCAGKAADDLRAANIRPVVWTAESAAAWRTAKPVLSIDTGQGRFGCAPDRIAEVIEAGAINEAMTHATAVEHVERFVNALRDVPGVRFRHAAGSALLDEPAAWLDAVRPGYALYDGAVRTMARLIEVRDSHGGPAGYTGFITERYGVILAGYSNGLRRGPCVVNGRQTRLLEVGMQSAFVELAAVDRVGDSVELLGESSSAPAVAKAWGTSPQEVIFRLSRSGKRTVFGT